MTTSIERITHVKDILAGSNYTCVACTASGEILTSKRRGVAPLVAWLDANVSLSGGAAADKVIGKGAAMLYVLLKVDCVHALVASEAALNTLAQYGITATCDKRVPFIENRTHDGRCPMESAVWDIDDPLEALMAIRAKMDELHRAH